MLREMTLNIHFQQAALSEPFSHRIAFYATLTVTTNKAPGKLLCRDKLESLPNKRASYLWLRKVKHFGLCPADLSKLEFCYFLLSLS